VSEEAQQPIEITGLSSDGEGIGRLDDGRVAFVEGGVPGDVVELGEIEERKRFVRAAIARVVTPSADRVEPVCPHVGVCGGCQWQHVRYEAQLDAKRSIVANALERIGGFDLGEKAEGEMTVVPSPESYGYRARARWVESEAGLGYRGRGTRDVHPVDTCPVLVREGEAALATRTAKMRADAESLEAKSTEGRRDAKKGASGKQRRRAPRPTEWVVTVGSGGRAIVVRAAATGGRGGARPEEETVQLEVMGETLRIGGDTFVQGNALLWETLAKSVVERCLAPVVTGKPNKLVELYCGAGFFTLPLARAGLSIVAFESDRSALADLGYNLRQARLDRNVNIVPGRVETRRDLERRLKEADVVLVDPPRTGLDEQVTKAIIAAAPERVVYLSCNPATLARDLKRLAEAGYRPGTPTIFDLFPQTPHVETLVEVTLG